MPGPDGPTERLAAALAGDLDSPSGRAAVLAALLHAQVFAVVAATPTGVQPAARTGLRAEAGAELSVLLLALPDGRRALPVFADLMAMAAWRPAARPVALSGSEACAAALEQGAAEVVLDPGSRAVQLSTQEVRTLAAGFVPVPGSSLASRRTAMVLAEPGPVPAGLLDALERAVAPEGLRSARLLAGPDGLVLGVAARTPSSAADLAGLAGRVRERLGPELPVGGLDLTVVPLHGPGTDLLSRRVRRGWQAVGRVVGRLSGPDRLSGRGR